MSRIVDINGLYDLYYKDNPQLRRIIFIHSNQVARKALEIVKAKNIAIDSHLVYLGAMLHDIGVVKCHAPEIYAFGDLPYICHGIEGKNILQKHGLYQLAGFCERHTGSGLTAKEISLANLPLPKKDMLPVTLEEKLICYADKFFSKGGDLTKEKSILEIENQMKRYGDEVLNRFQALHKMFA